MLESATLEDAYYVASIVIAVFAVLGFIYSQASSKKVSNTLAAMSSSFDLLSQPMIKLTKWDWCVEKNEPISSNNPPIGIMIVYGNVSSVHLIVLDCKFSVYYGDKLLDEPSSIVGSKPAGESILSPGEMLHSRTIIKDLFVRYSTIEKDVSVAPHFSVKLEAMFKTIDGRKYSYRVHREIHFDTRNPLQATSKNLIENAATIP